MVRVKILFLLSIALGIFFLLGYYIRLAENKREGVQIDYSLVSDEGPIISDKFSYYEPVNQKNVDRVVPEELGKLVEDYLCGQEYYKEDCKGGKNERSKLNVDPVDLNEDGQGEYIVMPWTIYGNSIRGASGGGPVLIIQKSNNNLEIIGEFSGNGYVVMEKKTNGYHNILGHMHSSAASGLETMYKLSGNEGGIDDGRYVEVFTKWYRYRL